MTEFLGAGKSERTRTRQGYRSGYYLRDLTMKVGEIELIVPQERSGPFSTQLCCPRFQAAQRRQSSYASLWEKMRGAIWLLILHSWEQLYEALAGAEPDRSFGRPDSGFRPP